MNIFDYSNIVIKCLKWNFHHWKFIILNLENWLKPPQLLLVYLQTLFPHPFNNNLNFEENISEQKCVKNEI